MLNRLVLLVIHTLFGLSSSVVIAEDALESLDELKWKYRIILIKAEAQSEDWLYKLNQAEASIIDRDIIWIAIWENSYSSSYQNQVSGSLLEDTLDRYFSNANTRVVLIGKDGGVKDASSELNLPELFALIDGMPMRRAEMREDSNLP